MNYLPEWKIYLWKKLLLHSDDRRGDLKITDFLFFSEEEQRGAINRQLKDSIDTVNKATAVAYANRKALAIPPGGHTPTEDNYFSFKPKEVIEALLELAEKEPNSLEVSKIVLHGGYIDTYRSERKKYLATDHRNRIASIGHSSGGSTKEPDKRLSNEFCDLGADVFKVVSENGTLTVEQLKKLIVLPRRLPLWNHLTFDIKVNKAVLSKKLNDYLELFTTGELVAPPKVRYFDYKEQRARLCPSMKSLAKKYGNKNMPITFEELAREGGWYQKDEKHFRFYETIFSIEKAGDIQIKDLRKEEVVISLTSQFIFSGDSLRREDHPTEDFNLNTQREIETIKSITIPEDHRLKRDQWLATKRILDAMYKQIPTIGDDEYRIKINKDSLPPEQRSILGNVIKHAYKAGVLSSSTRREGEVKKPVAVISSETARTFLDGESLVVSDRHKFGAYRQKVSEIYKFAEDDGVKRFPSVYTKPEPQSQSSKLSVADQKKLRVLEKLKEEWDLVPKKNSGPMMIQAGMVDYRKRAYTTRVSWQRYVLEWLPECEIKDWYQLQNILQHFKDEGLLEDFESINPAR